MKRLLIALMLVCLLGAQRKPVLEVWTAEWCGSCQSFWQFYHHNAAFQAALDAHYRVMAVPYNGQIMPMLTRGVRSDSLPTFVPQDGRRTVVGFSTPEDLLIRLGIGFQPPQAAPNHAPKEQPTQPPPRLDVVPIEKFNDAMQGMQDRLDMKSRDLQRQIEEQQAAYEAKLKAYEQRLASSGQDDAARTEIDRLKQFITSLQVQLDSVEREQAAADMAKGPNLQPAAPQTPAEAPQQPDTGGGLFGWLAGLAATGFGLASGPFGPLVTLGLSLAFGGSATTLMPRLIRFIGRRLGWSSPASTPTSKATPELHRSQLALELCTTERKKLEEQLAAALADNHALRDQLVIAQQEASKAREYRSVPIDSGLERMRRAMDLVKREHPNNGSYATWHKLVEQHYTLLESGDGVKHA